MRYDPEVRASICYTWSSCAFLVLGTGSNRGIARMHGHGALVLTFIDVEIDQLRSRVYFHIALIDKKQNGCDGDLFWQRLSLPNKTRSNGYHLLLSLPSTGQTGAAICMGELKWR